MTKHHLPEDTFPNRDSQAREQGASLVLLPIAATVLFYCSPTTLQNYQPYQFFPQFCAYTSFLIWTARNTSITQRLGLPFKKLPQGLRRGIATGLLLGTFNTLVIVYLVPQWGKDYTFLTDTPHARIPVGIMVPWFIACIAILVELNFRGFLLGRLLSLNLPPACAIGTSALLFAFDPFLVATFQHLHWIAVWDGLLWGTLWHIFRNLYIPIVAHAVEVIVLYTVMRNILA
jgi:membrane protease YdiL (CAAX protease family)